MFDFMGQAIVRQCPPKRGKAPDAPVILTVKLEAVGVPVHAVAALLGTENQAEVREAFFEGDDIRFLEAVVHSGYEAEAIHSIKFSTRAKERVAKLSKCSMEPTGGAQFNVTFTVAIETPSADLQAYLASQINRAVRVHLECAQDDLVGFRRQRKEEGGPVQTSFPEPTERDESQLQQAADELEKPRKARARKSAKRKAA